ncbi:MAG: threonine--tRNA ligase, partial [Clostridia bacterium]|nr:threonine--tRNA ligase [Clostridia bacterium]
MAKIFITFPDGRKAEFDKGTSVIDIIKSISEGLARNAVCASINGTKADLTATVDNDCDFKVFTFNDEEGKEVYRHTTSHIMAQAVKRLYPNAKVAIGPAVKTGFYYDIDFEEPITQDDLAKIEAEMQNVIKENLPIVRSVMSSADAIKFFEKQNEPYKVEMIKDLGVPEVSIYTQGEYTDMCRGPHLTSTGKVKAFKLTGLAGAYWRGDVKNKMLSRIYGTAFDKKADLDEYLAKVEDAKRRDHNKIGRELEYFTTVDVIGQGLPILMPKGAKVIQILERFVEDTEEKWGYKLTKTPYMAKSDLYKISGHWSHYKEGMFILGDENKDKEVFALRPMTCPFQYQVFLNRQRSYRELPMRLNETSTLFRNEDSGEMHGLIRVRQFTISEAHLIIRPDQLKEEFKGCLELSRYLLQSIGLLEDVTYRFSQWDPENTAKYEGTKEQWDEAQKLMKNILDELGVNYQIGIGEAAFYGPKLDLQITNVHGKEDTLVTIQIDMLLAQKFGMEYIDVDGSKTMPYIIHRTSIGCYERTLALLLEKYAGALPLWFAPEQVRVMPISEAQNGYAKKVYDKLIDMGIRADLDDRNEKIGYRIREAQLDKIPYTVVV